MASVTCGLTAEDRDQLQNPMLISSMGLLLSALMLLKGIQLIKKSCSSNSQRPDKQMSKVVTNSQVRT